MQISWNQTEHGSIAIKLSPAINSIHQNSQWNTSECHERGQTKLTFQFSPEGSDGGDDDDDYQKRFRKLAIKVEKQRERKVKELDENVKSWYHTPTLFLGRTKFTSDEQWSSNALDFSEKEVVQNRSPFHRLNLVRRLNERIATTKSTNPNHLEMYCRRPMMREMYPDFDVVNEKKREAYRKRYQRHIKYGRVDSELKAKAPGLLLTVGPFITRDEYVQFPPTVARYLLHSV